MSNRVFTWRAINDTTATVKVRSLNVQFGDGYRQIAGDGINSVSEEWPITIIGELEPMKAARDFLREHAGSSFLWTTPMGERIRVTSNDYQLQPVGGRLYTLSATFQQFFKPQDQIP